MEGLRQDFTTDKGYLNNPTFYEGLSKWNTENETTFFLVGNKWIWANGNVLSRKGNSAIVCTDDGRTVVRIRNKYILQEHENLRSIPSFEANEAGELEAIPVYLSIFYRCAKSGTLKVEFENVDKTGFANFNSFLVEEELAVTDGYKQYTCNGLWNGTGDFRLSFTGDIYLYMLVLSTDKIESLTHKYKTLFEQSERLVRISAAVFDKDENALKETGLFIKPEGAGLYAQDSDGNVALIGVSVDETDEEGNKIGSTIKLTADNIQLEGLITANGNFKILEDGSIYAKNGTFDGYIKSQLKDIEESDSIPKTITFTGDGTLYLGEKTYLLNNDLNLRVDCPASFSDGATVVLPSDPKYIGSRVLLWNGCVPPYTRTYGSIRFSRVCVERNLTIKGLAGSVLEESITDWNDPTFISWINGSMELVGVPDKATVYDEEGNPVVDGFMEVTEDVCSWCILSFSAVSFEYHHLSFEIS